MSDILEKLAQEVDKISEDNADNESSEKSTEFETEGKIQDESEEPQKMSEMDKLMAQNPIHFPQKGDTIVGTVLDVSSNEIYLDLTPYGTGIVLGKEIKDGMGTGKLKIGDSVSAIVIDSENEDGYIELSIREASYEKAWDDIESKRDLQEKVSTKIISANKGGLLVEVNGISGFLPVSQLSSKNYPRVEDGDKNKILSMLKKLVGKELEVRIIDADRELQKLIVSEKAAQSEKDRAIISNLKVGDVISGEISGVVDFGAFVKFSSLANKSASVEEERLEGLVHISELAWQLIEDPRTIVKVGDKVEAKIIGIDADKISLSIRALQKDPWSEIDKKYNVGDVVQGTVHRINPFGAFVYLDRDIHGLAHVSEMSETYPGKNIDELIKTGETYSWKILSIEPKEHRMGLVLVKKPARDVSPIDANEKKQDGAEKEKAPKTKIEKGSVSTGKDSTSDSTRSNQDESTHPESTKQARDGEKTKKASKDKKTVKKSKKQQKSII